MLDRRGFLKSSALGASAAMFSASPLASIAGRWTHRQKTEKKLITRRLGNTGIELPVVSMGVMRSDNPELVRAALAAGMRHLDTAHSYMEGNNESMLGGVLKDYPRSSFVISTKVPPMDAASFLDTLDESLRRLRMDFVDILYVHGPSAKSDVLDPAILAALRSAKESGKAKHVGVSTHKNEPDVIRWAASSGVYEVVLTSVNFRQDHYAEVRAAMAEGVRAGLGIVGMKTMAGGFYDRARTKPINCKAAIKWVLQDPNLTTTIPGITSFEMLAQNASVNEDITLTDEEKASLAHLPAEGGLYCQGCGNCTRSCGRHLPIPDVMRAYMYTYGYGAPRGARSLLRDLGLGADPCGECPSCTAHCAKGFAVRERICDVSRLIDIPEEFLA
ncbi:MAG TPA: aldo/keto reductase [Bacteroidota bacterium]|nr:aldo/keto reductase [Bacteroidota bacterium]